VAVPLEDPSLPSFTGKFTTWGGFNQNGTTVNGTFTFNVRGTGSDGSTFSNHNTGHFNTRPDGSVNEFFHCHLPPPIAPSPALRRAWRSRLVVARYMVDARAPGDP
jgi:hypothetical protein